MEFFKWKDSFDIGDAEIDRQHRSLLETLNEYYVSTSGDMKDVVDAGLLKRLKDYAFLHFRFEEELMESLGYEGLAKQREQHRYFETLVSDLEAQVHQGRKDALRNAVAFLRDWFLRHVLEEDKKIAARLKQRQDPLVNYDL